MKRALAFLLLAPAIAFGAFDANGVRLGDNEAAVKKAFPGIHCKPLEWKSDAADRRCDDAKIPFAGIEARVTLYLKADSVRGFDVRFDSSHIAPVAEFLKTRFGKPVSEAKDKIVRKGKEEREVFKILWEAGQDKALLSSLSTAKRAQLSVARGNFEDEIYRIK
jgi:hypothetical protein